jgi:hypothetical protein
MSARADALAEKVQGANDALKQAIESSSDEQWKAKCSDGVWTQGFAGYHAANSIGFITGMIQGLAAGQALPPITMAQIDEGNAQDAQAHMDTCSKQEVLSTIASNSPASVQLVRGLSDEQLDRRVSLLQGAPEMSVEQVIELLLVGHSAGHTATITGAR